MDSLENVIAHTFHRPQLLAEALTHASLAYESQRRRPDNQRLEFLGDAVLQLVLSDELFHRLTGADEGMLTKARAQLVSTKALARLARQFKLGTHIHMGRGEEANGGRDRENTLADVMEAIVGAIYLDGGPEAARAFVRRTFAAELAALGTVPLELNPKGELQELLQGLANLSPTYAIVEESGPDHLKSFTAVVSWQGRELGRGGGRSKKEAEIEAARAALGSTALTELMAAAKGGGL